MRMKTSLILSEGFNINGRTVTVYPILLIYCIIQLYTSMDNMALFITFNVCICVVNVVFYYMIDMWFSYAPALHSIEYKSNHYSVEKKLAVKKFSNRGYIGL